MSKEFIHYPELYRELSEPFKSTDDCNEALVGFTKELRDIRAKYHIRELLVVMKGSAITESGEEGGLMVMGHHGNAVEEEGMAAWAFGQAQARRQQRMSDLVAEAKSIKVVKGGR